MPAVQPSDALRRALLKVEAIAAGCTSATVHSFLASTPSTSTKQDLTLNTQNERRVALQDGDPLHLSLSRPLMLQTSQRLELRTAVSAVARKTQGSVHSALCPPLSLSTIGW